MQMKDIRYRRYVSSRSQADCTRWDRIKDHYTPPPPPESCDDSPETKLAGASILSKLTFHVSRSLGRGADRSGWRRS